MKYCESCGNQLTDNAVFCPKCGTRVGGNSETPQPVENNNQNQVEGLTTAQKITLGVVAFIAFSGLFSGEWIPAIICVCVLAAVVAIFMGAIDTKYTWKATICCAIAVMIAAVTTADKEESNQSQNQTEQKQESPAEKAAREKREKQEKIDRMMKEAFARGKDQAMNYTYYQKCDQWFNAYYFTPETDEEIELFKRYRTEYDKGWDEGKRIKAKINN
ncbi:MAG: zinc-ribbon domain-containing protein [Prevotella sp.]|nr:zinc-ribbon domain-containing protein [Prevotella sp.]